MSNQLHNSLKNNEDANNQALNVTLNDQINLKKVHIELKAQDQHNNSCSYQSKISKNKNDEINNILQDKTEQHKFNSLNLQKRSNETNDKKKSNENDVQEEIVQIEIQNNDNFQVDNKDDEDYDEVDWQKANQNAQNLQQSSTMYSSSQEQNLISFIEAWQNLKGQNLAELKKLIVRTPSDKKNESFFGLLNNFCGVTNPHIMSAELLKERDQIFAIAKMQYKENDNFHFQMLYSVYSTLTENYNFPKTGHHWEQIGFQGTKPQTDFRGTGILGLLQILAIVTQYKEFMVDALEYSHDPVHCFPLCVALINVTDIVLQACKEQKLNRLINREKSVISVFNNVYFATFFLLFTIYKQQKMTIGQFGELRQNVEFTLKQNPKKVVEDFKLGIQQYYKYRD